MAYPHPLHFGLISPTDLSPHPRLSCQAKYFGLAGGAGRTERSQQTNPCGLGAGRAGAGRGPCTRPGDSAACAAASGGLAAERAPTPTRGPRETLPCAPEPLRLSSAQRAPQASLCPRGWPHSAPHRCDFLPVVVIAVSSYLSLSVSVSVSCRLCVGFLVSWSLTFPSPLKPVSLCPLGPVRPFCSPQLSGGEPGLGRWQCPVCGRGWHACLWSSCPWDLAWMHRRVSPWFRVPKPHLQAHQLGSQSAPSQRHPPGGWGSSR